LYFIVGDEEERNPSRREDVDSPGASPSKPPHKIRFIGTDSKVVRVEKVHIHFPRASTMP
jgi:hypothetical protein